MLITMNCWMVWNHNHLDFLKHSCHKLVKQVGWLWLCGLLSPINAVIVGAIQSVWLNLLNSIKCKTHILDIHSIYQITWSEKRTLHPREYARKKKMGVILWRKLTISFCFLKIWLYQSKMDRNRYGAMKIHKSTFIRRLQSLAGYYLKHLRAILQFKNSSLVYWCVYTHISIPFHPRSLCNLAKIENIIKISNNFYNHNYN